MDVVAASATMAQRVCSPVPIFYQRTRGYVSTRRLRLAIISKGRGNESDLHRDEAGDTHLVPFLRNDRGGSITPLSKDAAMGLVLNAATGRGWTTGSGMEGPSVPATEADEGNRVVSTFPWSLFTKSPRRRMLIAFTCKVCGQRTTRAINPHAYTDGTVFVQCCGCNVFHKLVDNLNLFQGMKCYVNPDFNYNVDNIHYKSGDLFGHMEEEEEEEDGDDDMFPRL